jgi:hypothetical protein
MKNITNSSAFCKSFLGSGQRPELRSQWRFPHESPQLLLIPKVAEKV